MEPTYSIAPQAEAVGGSCPGLLLKNVYTLYRNQFPSWFGITAPTSLLATAVLWMADQRIKAIFRSIPRGQFQFHAVEIGEAGLLRYGSFFLSWLLGCFALAAIATVVSGLEADNSDAVWIHDSHERAREYVGKLLLAALFTFCAFLAGMALVLILDVAVSRVVDRSHFSRYNYAVALGGYVAVASVLSWFGMAIPLILRGNVSFWAGLKRSVELSKGYEGALFWLVVQSVAASYLAAYGTYYVFSSFFPAPLQHTIWYGGLVFIVAVLAGAAVEPPIFIGFSLLADPDQLKVSVLPGS